MTSTDFQIDLSKYLPDEVVFVLLDVHMNETTVGTRLTFLAPSGKPFHNVQVTNIFKKPIDGVTTRVVIFLLDKTVFTELNNPAEKDNVRISLVGWMTSAGLGPVVVESTPYVV